MTRRKKIIITVIATPLLIFILLWLIPPKQSTVNDADLQFIRRPVVASQNGFTDLQNARAAIRLPGNLDGNLSAHAGGKQWDPDVAARILATNQPALVLWRDAMARGDLQIPAPRTIADEYPYLAIWKKTAQLALVDSGRLAREGQGEAALAEALRVLEFGQRIENADGVMIHYLVALAVKSIALDHIRRLAHTPGITPAQLRPVIGKLAAFRTSGPGLTNIFKHEYQLMMQEFANVTAGKAATSFSDRALARVGGRVFYDDGKTRLLAGNATRLCLQSIPLTLKETALDGLLDSRAKLSVVKAAMRGNAIGEVLFAMTSPQWAGMLGKKCQENSAIAATQAVLAMKCFTADHGRLPAQLDELVPQYLPALPIDDFDGKPLRYLLEKKLIYAIGRDLIDSGGTPATANVGTDDIVFDVEPTIPDRKTNP